MGMDRFGVVDQSHDLLLADDGLGHLSVARRKVTIARGIDVDLDTGLTRRGVVRGKEFDSGSGRVFISLS